jgi:hypothetical protein
MRAGGRASRRGSAKAMNEQEFDELRRSAFATTGCLGPSLAVDLPVPDEIRSSLRLRRRPAEDVSVEVPRSVYVARQQVVPGPGTRLVDELGSPQLSRLPESEDRPIWVLTDGQRPRAARDLERSVEDRSPRLADLAGSRPHVVHLHVSQPGGSLALHPDPLQAGDQLARVAQVPVVLRIGLVSLPFPAEQVAVEPRRPLDVRRDHLHPAELAIRILLPLTHPSPPS